RPPRSPLSTLFPYTTLFRSVLDEIGVEELATRRPALDRDGLEQAPAGVERGAQPGWAGAHDHHVVVECSPIRHTSRNSSRGGSRSEEHTSELQSRVDVVCRI